MDITFEVHGQPQLALNHNQLWRCTQIRMLDDIQVEVEIIVRSDDPPDIPIISWTCRQLACG